MLMTTIYLHKYSERIGILQSALLSRKPHESSYVDF